MKTKYRGGILRAVSVALAGALVAVGGAAGAQAATGKPVIDPDQLGSITIHKYEYPDTALDLPANGMEQTIPDGAATPMADVTFQIQQVLGYDLTTNADWLRLKDLTPAAAATGSLGAAQTDTTGADGIASFSDLPIGVYLVTETGYPAGVTPVDPFLITVPLTNPTNANEWVYDVHVYPKNPVTTATKTVDDDAAIKLGDTVTFTIKGDIPEVEVIDGYKVVDVLDSKLTWVSTVVTLVDGTELLAGDYTATHNAGTVTVVFTPAGLEKLAENSGTQVQVVINTTVNTVGEIENDAYVYPNLPSFDVEPGEPGGPTVTPEVETKWGNVTIHKVAQTTNANLKGAEFAIYPTKADALAGTNAIATGTTLADGTLTFTGLRYTAWADGEEVALGDTGYQTYWIAETKAPAGYELLAEPVEVVVDDTDTTVDYTVKNVPSNGGFDLPLTGGMGTVAITVAGTLLIAGALLLAVRSRRRETTNG